MSFSNLNLSLELIDALPKAFKKPTEIQSQSVPLILKGNDLLAIAQTGSGKTLAYGLPIIETMLTDAKALQQTLESNANELNIIIVPTRELAAQVHTELSKVIETLAQASKLEINSLLLCGGVDKDSQVEQLQNQPHLVVATPGRLLDLIQTNHLTVNNVKRIVLDEADRLLDMGFWPDIQTILAALPQSRQTMMFSATLPSELEERLNGQLKQPSYVQVNQINQVVDNIEERLFLVNKGSKTKALIQQIETSNWSQVLVFISAKDNANALAKKLTKAGIACAALHGDKSQSEREQTLAKFKQKSIQVLIATDLLARGIHIDDLPVVINFDLPSDPTVYVHRVGRTARAGQQGLALSLVCHGEKDYLEAIRTTAQRSLATQTLSDFPVTDKPSSGESKRAPRDKKANRRTNNKTSAKQFQKKAKRPNR
ncbi:DEAD/DEAH box helicase [Vibrio lamellibrachiae]|uniref:DEAD/DEAH box helicase n=1 Tax=Vibrio lamellibrachiae TaxID=2910253 RepID=UPI003D0D5C0C